MPRAAKRKVSTENDCESDVSSFLPGFGNNLVKSRLTERESAKQLVEKSIEDTLSSILDRLNTQVDDRKKFEDEHFNKLTALLEQKADDLEKAKQACDEMQMLMHYQEKEVLKMREQSSETLNGMKETTDDFFKNADDLRESQMKDWPEIEDDAAQGGGEKNQY